MIFRRRRNTAGELEQPDGVEETPAEDDPTAEGAEESPPPDEQDLLSELDAQDWRTEGPWDIDEVDLDDDESAVGPRIDLGSLVLTGVQGMELRLQALEETSQIVSAMLVLGDSALELAAFAAPRSGGLWAELRDDMIAQTAEAGGSTSLLPGPFGVELQRFLPVTMPDGQAGYQPARTWVVEGPRWLLRGVVYGQAAVTEGVGGPVAPLLDAFRLVVVRRGSDAMAPGDLLPLSMPEGLVADPAGQAPESAP